MAKDSPPGSLRDIIGGVVMFGSLSVLAYQNWPHTAPPFIEFGTSRAVEPIVSVGEPVPMVFTMRRNTPCDTVVHMRFASNGRFLPGFGVTIGATQAAVTEAFVDFPISIPTDGLPPGEYSYQPLLTCKETGEQVEPPPVRFTIQ